MQLQRQQTSLINPVLQQKPSLGVNKVSSPVRGVNMFLNGDFIPTDHLKTIYFEYSSLQDGIQQLQEMLKYAIENHENVVRDKFLVKKNRLSRKKREIYDQELQLQRQEMELNQNPQIKKALFDLAQLKEFHGRKEKQYQTIQTVISKEDETLKKLRTIHEEQIEKLKSSISTTIDTQLRIDKMKKYIKFKRAQQANTLATQLNLQGIQLKEGSIINTSKQGTSYLAQIGNYNNANTINKTPLNSFSLEYMNPSQLPVLYSQSTKNINMSKYIMKNSNIFRNSNETEAESPSIKYLKNNNQNEKNRLNINTSMSVPSLLKNNKQIDNILSTNSSMVQQNYIVSPSMNQNTSKILASNEFEDMESIIQVQQMQWSEYELIKRNIKKQKEEIEQKRKYIFKHCNNSLQLNDLVKECFNLVSKKLSSTLSMSDKKGFRESMYLSIKSNNLFITQNEQIMKEFKEIQHNQNVNVQDRQLGSIIFDSLMNIIKKQEFENINKQHIFPDISYKNFSYFTLGQILTIITIKPELKEQLFIPFELKRQTIHLFLEDMQRKV